MNRRRLALPVVAAGLVALALPLAGGAPAGAFAAAEEGEKKFGYSALTTATPVYIEVYEPTIPIPAYPQAEVMFGYTRVVADSSSSRGRASYVWPGDAVGEGAKTIEQALIEDPRLQFFPIPDEVKDSIYEAGYPLQVNSGYPSGAAGEANEPAPGTVMRTGATEKATYAQSGYSSTCDTSGGEEGGGEGGEEPPVPGLPEIPIPIPGLENLFDALSDRSATTTRSSARSAAAEEPATECQIPAQMAALATFGGFQASTYAERTPGEIRGVSRSAVGDVSLFGGVITMSGVKAKVTSSSDGTAPKGKGKANYGTITIAGEEFSIGPDGIEGGGQASPIPGLPDEPKAALAELGVTVTVPEPVFDVDEKEIKSVVEGLIIEIDTKTLSDGLRTLPLQDILDQLPEDMKELKKALQAAINLSPRIVIHLGRATAKVETADPIEIPDFVPDNDPGAEETTEDTGGSSGGGATGGAAGGVTSPTTTPTASSPTTTDTALPPAELASGLPALFSIPGLLMVGAIAGACVAGSYIRRMGAMALGGGGACSHGLDSGLPDLRKVNS
ncbi:choice-of-anchor P family protein [Nocardioides dilutus]